MATTFYRTATGNGVSTDGNIPDGAVVCTAAQYADPTLTVVAGAIAAAPPPVLTLAQRAAALIAGGLTITSATLPALNGVYTVQSGVPFGQEDIATEAQFISTFAEFTNGTSADLPWPLLSDAAVIFPTTAAFLSVAKAAAQFVSAVKAAVLLDTALPAAVASIP
jgi:hypothetical protein